jgi:hypothetical protein
VVQVIYSVDDVEGQYQQLQLLAVVYTLVVYQYGIVPHLILFNQNKRVNSHGRVGDQPGYKYHST